MRPTINVLTAGPSAGKSSCTRELSARGYDTLPEGARIVLDQAISEGRDVDEYRSDQQYQEDVIEKDRAIENQLPLAMAGGEAVFLDRSLADNIAYGRYFWDTEYKSLVTDCKWRYDNIFLLERIDFKEDEARTEDEQMAQEIHEELRRAYEDDLGHSVIDVPLMPVDKRVDYILERVK